MDENLQFLLTDIAQYFINGLVQGSIYALVALGYTMVYGIIRLINFAHGEFFMIGSFIGFFAVTKGLPLWLAFILSMLGSGLIAVVVEKLLYKPIRNAGRVAALITALGVSLFFQYFGQNTIGAEPQSFPSVLADQTLQMGDVFITRTQIVIMCTTFFLMIGLWFFVTHTRIGKAMRATGQNFEAAALMGINTDTIISLTFFIGATLAGAAGVMWGLYYNTVEPMMGIMPGLKAFVAAVLGGIGLIPGAVLGGLVLGVVENMVTGLWESTYRDAIAFGILVVILLIRPSGLLGKHQREKV